MMVILDPEVMEDEIAKELEALKGLIVDNKGDFDRIEEWGRRTLAYPIKKKTEGYYALLHFGGEPALLSTLREGLKHNANVLRNMIVRKD
jgi:small subunit ribosomal protein S6